MVKPPLMVFTSIAVAPLRRCNGAHLSFEIGKVLEPVIAFAADCAGVIPVVVPLAIRRKVDIAHRGSAGGGLFITDEALPQVIVAFQPLECLFQNGLGAVPHVLEHFPDAALIGKSHDDKTPSRCFGVPERWGVAP